MSKVLFCNLHFSLFPVKELGERIHTRTLVTESMPSTVFNSCPSPNSTGLLMEPMEMFKAKTMQFGRKYLFWDLFRFLNFIFCLREARNNTVNTCTYPRSHLSMLDENIYSVIYSGFLPKSSVLICTVELAYINHPYFICSMIWSYFSWVTHNNCGRTEFYKPIYIDIPL